eukprot:2341970-Rhodomonas_salina.2
MRRGRSGRELRRGAVEQGAAVGRPALQPRPRPPLRHATLSSVASEHDDDDGGADDADSDPGDWHSKRAQRLSASAWGSPSETPRLRLHTMTSNLNPMP